MYKAKFWQSSTNAADVPQLDLDLLKLLEEAKTKVRDPETIQIVEAAYFELKGHLWCLSKCLLPLALHSTRVAYRDKKKMANAGLKYENHTRPDCQQMPATKDFGAKRLKHFFGPDTWDLFLIAT